MLNRRHLILVAVTVGYLSAAREVRGDLSIKAGDVAIVLRQSPLRIDNNNIQTVRRGTILVVESVDGQWLWVTQGKSGWIQRRNVIARDRAVAHFSQELQRNPSSVEALRCRGKAFLSLGDVKRAVADFNQALARGQSPLLHADRGMAWSLAGDYEKAIADFDEAVRTYAIEGLSNDELAAIHCLRGLARAGKGEVPEAIVDFDEAIGLSAGLAFAWNQRGRAWLAQDKSTMKAIADFNEAINLNPVYDSAYNGRGLSWAAMGEFDNAVADFRAAIELDPDSTFARGTRSRMLAESIRRTKERGSDSLRLLDPLESPRNNLALLLATCPDDRFRDGKEALQIAEELCRLDGHRYGAFLSTLAAACAEAGDFTGAVKWQTKALETTQDQKKDELRSRLALYQAGKPYRQKSK